MKQIENLKIEINSVKEKEESNTKDIKKLKKELSETKEINNKLEREVKKRVPQFCGSLF